MAPPLAARAYYASARPRKPLPHLTRPYRPTALESGRSFALLGGPVFASAGTVRHVLTLAVGILIGQWLAFSAVPSPADFDRRGMEAWERQDYAGALKILSQGVSLQPDNAVLHYRRAMA